MTNPVEGKQGLGGKAETAHEHMRALALSLFRQNTMRSDVELSIIIADAVSAEYATLLAHRDALELKANILAAEKHYWRDRAEASEQKLAEAEAEIERMTNLEGFTYGHLEAAKEEIAALEQRLSAALGELHSLLALGLYDDAEPALILARKKSASLEALLRRARPLLDGSHDALKYVWSKVRPASRKDAEDCLAALATLSSEITALLPSGTGEAEGEGR